MENITTQDNLLQKFEAELHNNVALKENPSQLASLVIDTVMALDQSRASLSVAKEANTQLKKHHWWKKLLPYNNNLKKVALSQENLIEAVGQQQQSMQAFLTLIKGVIFLNVGNLKFLLKLTDELRQGGNRFKIKDPTLLNMATGLLDEAVKAAQHQEAQLDYVKKFLLNEIDTLRSTLATQQDQLNVLNLKVEKLKIKERLGNFKWPFIFMFVLNLGVLLLLIYSGIK